MSRTLRISIAALFCSSGLAPAADPPSTQGIDLGSMKLKRATAPTAAAPAAAPATTALPAVQKANVVQRQPANTTAAAPAAIASPQPVAAAPQQAAPATPAAAQTGIGTVVTAAPIGRRTAADILNQTPTAGSPQQSSGDAQVKLPSMFKKVNP